MWLATGKEVKHEDQEVRHADRARDQQREGAVISGGDRTSTARRSPLHNCAPAYRLKRSIDVFAASNGAVYLMRAGSGDDLVLEEPDAPQRAVVELLSEDWQQAEGLSQALEARSLSDGVDHYIADLEEIGLLERQLPEPLLEPAELERYDRQLIYWSDLAGPATGSQALQRRLAEARVVILGCGGLGCWAAASLACAGVGTLILIDDDRVELSNLNRQILFGQSDIGREKVDAAASSLSRHNPAVDVRTVNRRIRSADDLLDAIEGADQLISVADSPPYKLPRWVNEACLSAGVPYLSAAQFLPRVRVGPMVIRGESACFECLERQTRRRHPLYDEVADRASPPVTAATLGAGSGVAGSLLAMETLHYLSGVVIPATVDTAIILDLKTLTLTRETVERDPLCPMCSKRNGSPSDSAPHSG